MYDTTALTESKQKDFFPKWKEKIAHFPSNEIKMNQINTELVDAKQALSENIIILDGEFYKEVNSSNKLTTSTIEKHVYKGKSSV